MIKRLRDKGKSTCLLKFRSMCGTDEWKQRSNNKMGRSSGRIQDVSFLQSTMVNRWISIEFEWNIFPGFSSLQNLQEIEQDFKRMSIEPEGFTDQIIFMVHVQRHRLDKKRNWWDLHFEYAEKVKDYAMRFLQHWTFLGPGSEKKWHGEWDSTANKMVQRSKETGHSVFKSISSLSRGILKRKKGKETHTLQRRFIEHRTLLPNNSFRKSAQYLRCRGELV